MKLKNIKFSWSKWGRTATGLEIEGRPDQWVCQVCGEQQPKGIEAYLFPFSEGEFVRICSICQHIRHTKYVYKFVRLKRLRQILTLG